MLGRELRELIQDGQYDDCEVIVGVDNKMGGIDLVLHVEQEYDGGPDTFGLFATWATEL